MELVLFSMLWVQGSLCTLSHTHVVILYKLISISSFVKEKLPVHKYGWTGWFLSIPAGGIKRDWKWKHWFL